MTTPIDDLVAHEHEDCVCGPALVPVVAGDGQRCDITIHHPLVGLGHLAAEPIRPAKLR